MSQLGKTKAGKIPATLSEKSTWTPKNHLPSNEKIFEERLTLIKKWYAAWSEEQRWVLLEHILKQLKDEQLVFIHSLLQPLCATPPPNHDFTRKLPRFLCLRIFSMLDPQTLCRASQVCWYWKYLAECNEIWQEKCLRLCWFLPTPPPPQMNDHTLWKRHYIECVCQLHWNPPQIPTDEAGAGDDSNGDIIDATTEKATKKRTVIRHLVSDKAQKPWMDPDPHPADTQYCYKIDTAFSPLYSRFPYLRPARSEYRSSRTNAEHTTPTTTSMGMSSAPPLTVPPPSALLHPTLMEKMRLNSPTLAHVALATLNRSQTQDEMNETLYKLQAASPFPKLPPYFVHRKERMDTEDVNTAEESRGALRLPSYSGTHGSKSGVSVVTTGGPHHGRPSSGKSGVSVATPSDDRGTSLWESSQRDGKATLKEELGAGLPTRPWHIPYEEDDDV